MHPHYLVIETMNWDTTDVEEYWQPSYVAITLIRQPFNLLSCCSPFYQIMYEYKKCSASSPRFWFKAKLITFWSNKNLSELQVLCPDWCHDEDWHLSRYFRLRIEQTILICICENFRVPSIQAYYRILTFSVAMLIRILPTVARRCTESSLRQDVTMWVELLIN